MSRPAPLSASQRAAQGAQRSQAEGLASAPGRGQLFCATLTTHDPTDPASVKLLEQAHSSR